MRRLLLLVVLASGVATVTFYLAGLPWVSEIPAWFYRYRAKELGSPVFGGIAIGASVLLAVAALRGIRRGPRLAMALLVISSAGLQLGTSAIVEDDFFQRHRSGHGQYFAVTAKRRGEWLTTLRYFERLAGARELGSFAPSKPPGVFVPYMALDAIARAPGVRHALAPIADAARARPRLERYAETVALSMLLMPLLTALVIPATHRLGRALFDDDTVAWGSAILWMTIPATLLIQYHLDGAVYPLLAASACALAATGARTDRLGWSAAAGVALMLGIYVSFSLLVAVPLALGCWLAVAIDRARAGAGRTALARIAMHVFVAAVLASATFLALRFLLRFDLLVRYENAIAYHARWKAGVPSDVWRLAALVEYALYVGVPLVVVWLFGTGRGLVRLARLRIDTVALTSVGLVVVLAITSALSGTNEVSRMWMLLNPFLALSAATGLRALARDNEGEGRAFYGPLLVVALTQLVVALFMKVSQEW